MSPTEQEPRHPRAPIIRQRPRISPRPVTTTPPAPLSPPTTPASEPYEIGYAKPPKKNQWQKGQSGNPKGKAKGVVGVNTMVRRNMEKKITVRSGGRAIKMTVVEALLQRIMELASKGDLRAIMQCLQLYRNARPDELDLPGASEAPPTGPLTETDQAILAEFATEIIAGLGRKTAACVGDES